MEEYTYEGKNQRRIEIFMLFIYSIYNLGILSYGDDGQWPVAVMIIMIGGNLISWGLYVGNVGNYRIRAFFSVIMSQISMLLYCVNVSDVVYALPLIVAFAVFLSIYGILNIMYVNVASTVIVFFWHVVIAGTIELNTIGDVITLILQMGNVLLIEYVIFVTTKKNRDGSRRLLGVIEELEEVERSKDDFLANASHEIRTPINTICGMSEVVLSENLPYKIKENIKDIQIAGRNLMFIVNDILDYSELKNGKIELEEEAYNIASTINDVINMSLAKKNEKKIELIVDCNANIPCVLLGDEKKLRRVIMNLVDNAIKFTDVGCVSITIGYRVEKYGINLIVTVKDTGIGIEEESLEKIFDDFNQVNTKRNRQTGGLGLGLAISHAIIRKMGGAITIKSKVSKGTTVQFVVPQKVLDDKPVASINDKDNINVATYIDMEQFEMMEIRDEYSKNIVHMVEQLKGKCHICRNFAQLQKRMEVEKFSHVFISIAEYKMQKEYFDELADKTKLCVVLDRYDEQYINNQVILKIYKPYYILTIVSVLNGLYDTVDDERILTGKFVTRDAKVLVVDDNRMNLRVIESLLNDYRIKVVKAISGKEALDKISSSDYDFVFMDHMMPEMDGVEALRRIRHKVGTYYSKVPIVALTANAVAGTREMLLSEGFNDFLEKPIERSVLERVLIRNLPQDKIVYGHKHEMREMAKEITDNPETVNVNVDGLTELKNVLEPEGLDVSKGILYCNGIEGYLEILKGYCTESEDMGKQVDEFFERHDWKNYTIAVHGMKSAMRSIGAVNLAEIARKLEMAGKEGGISYIIDNHHNLMTEYEKLFTRLRNSRIIMQDTNATNGDEEDRSRLRELDDETFDKILKDMEEAMYEQDRKSLNEQIAKLDSYEYNGTALSKALVQVKRKIEMADYFSAVELAVKVKSKLSHKE